MYRVLATNCDNDTDTLRVVERMQMFLTRVEVQRTLTTARKPMRPVKPTVVERFENGFLLRWCASKADDEKQALHFHYELQYGFRYTGSWKAVHVVEDTEYRLTDLKPGTSYMVRVRALNPKGWSTFSETIQVTTLKPKNGDSIAEKGMPSGFFSMIGALPDAYDELVKSIIRPPRAVYDVDELGAKRFRITSNKGKANIYKRTDFEVLNSRNLKLKCSHWEPEERGQKKKKRPILIYLHGNCGCRVDAIECLEGALKNDMTVLGVDLSGSGHSEGEYITLGWNEKEDVWDLIRYMKAKGTVSSVCLWGRSMGMMYQIDFFFLLLTLKQQQQQQVL